MSDLPHFYCTVWLTICCRDINLGNELRMQFAFYPKKLSLLALEITRFQIPLLCTNGGCGQRKSLIKHFDCYDAFLVLLQQSLLTQFIYCNAEILH